MGKKSKERACPACGESYSKQRPRCPSCGETNDLLKQDTAPRGGLLEMIPGLQDLPDTTKILIGGVVMLVAFAASIVVYLLITRA